MSNSTNVPFHSTSRCAIIGASKGGIPMIDLTDLSLGKRILRAETAALTAVGLGMLHVEMNLDNGEQA